MWRNTICFERGKKTIYSKERAKPWFVVLIEKSLEPYSIEFNMKIGSIIDFGRLYLERLNNSFSNYNEK